MGQALHQGATADSPPHHHEPACTEMACRRGVEPLTCESVVQGVIHPSIGARGREVGVQAVLSFIVSSYTGIAQWRAAVGLSELAGRLDEAAHLSDA
jgi:hypothetical protein